LRRLTSRAVSPQSSARFSRARRIPEILVWALVAIGLMWVVVRLFGLERGYPLVPLIAYTPYVAALAVPVAAAAAALRMWPAAAAAALVAVALAIVVLPRAFGSGDSVDRSAGERLDVLAANLMLGNAEPEALVELVRSEQIDVLAVQELTPQAVAGLREAGLEKLLGERALFPAPRSGGSGIYARYRLRGVDAGSTPPGGFLMPRAAVELPGGAAAGLVSVHPVPPTDSSQIGTWEEGLESLPEPSTEGGPWVLAGDFNATLDHAELRAILDSGYVDAADASGAALSPTWPSDLIPPPVTIDHVLADEGLAVADASIHDLPGSDHRAVSAELYLTPAR
jgi:endonuclease/exonuclease/phosphatase family metal-dependent hydrolase